MKTETRNQILENAPEGATHYLINQYDFTEGYFKLTNDCDVLVDGVEGWQEIDIDVPLNGNHQVTELEPLRELQEKEQELIKMQARIDELEKIIAVRQLADKNGYKDGLEWVESHKQMDEILEAHNPTQQAKGISDFKEWVYKTDKNKSGLDVRDVDLADLFIENLLNQAKELK